MEIEKKKALESIKCSFCWKIFDRPADSFTIAQYRDKNGKQFTALGFDLPQQKSLLVELFGEWGVNPKDGRKQFRVSYYEICRQNDEEGVVAYLMSLKCGVGKKLAKTIYEHFKEETWSIIEKNPWRLREVKGIGATTANRIADVSQKTLGLKNVILLFIRANVKISAWQATAFLKEHPRDPIGDLEKNPYCACNIEGISFDKADAVADSLGFPPDHPERIKAFITKVLGDASSRGHVCLPVDQVINVMVDRLAVEENQVINALNEAWQEGFIKTTNRMVYTARSYREETTIAAEVCRIIRTEMDAITEVNPMIDSYERENFPLADSQREAVRRVFTSPLSIITGGPGTGKTTVINTILSVHKAIYGEESCPILLAPTGRAARRITEATGHYAQTIHSAVGYRGMEADADEEAELEGNLIIVDESSMMDQYIASLLFTKCALGTRVVLVGDPDQLPSVGYGNVLQDMIQSECIPTTKLNVIFRQSENNPIVANAHAINEGRVDLCWNNTFKQLICKDDSELFNTAVEFYIRCVKAYGMDNVVLLNPQRNNTRISVDAFNRTLQERLNPHRDGKPEMTVGKTTFRIGDKVMQLKNTDVAKNGDVGYIRDICFVPSEENPELKVTIVMVEFNGEGILHSYNAEEIRSVDLAYCSTVHKSQGEEYKTVIMVVSKAHPAMLRRNLVYTGITRAKENCCIITEETAAWEQSALQIAINNASCDQRYTNLIPRLRAVLPH